MTKSKPDWSVQNSPLRQEPSLTNPDNEAATLNSLSDTIINARSNNFHQTQYQQQQQQHQGQQQQHLNNQTSASFRSDMSEHFVHRRTSSTDGEVSSQSFSPSEAYLATVTQYQQYQQPQSQHQLQHHDQQQLGNQHQQNQPQPQQQPQHQYLQIEPNLWNNLYNTPSLSDAILETDLFLKNYSHENSPEQSSTVKMEVESDYHGSPQQQQQQQLHQHQHRRQQQSSPDTPAIAGSRPFTTSMIIVDKRSPNMTPTNDSPILTPKIGSPDELSSIFLNSILGNDDDSVASAVVGGAGGGDRKHDGDEGQLLDDLLKAIVQNPQRSMSIDEQSEMSHGLGLSSFTSLLTSNKSPFNAGDNSGQGQSHQAKHANNFFGAFAGLSPRNSSIGDKSQNPTKAIGACKGCSRAASSTHSSIRHYSTGLEPIPENDVPEVPSHYAGHSHPVLSLNIPKPVTTTYNISFPASNTLAQFSNRQDPWKRSHQGDSGLQPSSTHLQPSSSSQQSLHYFHHRNMSPMTTSSTSPGSNYFYSYSSNSSPGSLQSPFHEAPRGSLDLTEFQPLNFVRSDGTAIGFNFPAKSVNGEKVSNKATKRSRTNTPTHEDSIGTDLAGMLNPMDAEDHEDQADGASLRQRKKSSPTFPEMRRRNSIKDGIDELHRIMPHLGMPENEKISQASVLAEAAKFIQRLKEDETRLKEEISKVNQTIDELNQQIETFQNQLPDTGAPLLPPRALTSTRTLPQLFHDHVIDKTCENWRYWVFVAIVGHFVHSFAQEVSSNCFAELETTALEWVTNSMSLQQLRKDAYRKLAKLCKKTSIVENPSKLPQEAIDFATHRGKGGKKPAWYSEHPWP